MRFRILVGATMLVGLAVGTVANTGDVTPTRQWAIVDIMQPTRIASSVVMGPVLFVHDNAKMAKGLPCTSVYRFVPGRGPQEEIVAFHCKPNRHPVQETFTMSRLHDTGPTDPYVLASYQFAGDSEVHGVPIVR